MASGEHVSGEIYEGAKNPAAFACNKVSEYLFGVSGMDERLYRAREIIETINNLIVYDNSGRKIQNIKTDLPPEKSYLQFIFRAEQFYDIDVKTVDGADVSLEELLDEDERLQYALEDERIHKFAGPPAIALRSLVVAEIVETQTLRGIAGRTQFDDNDASI